MLLTVWMGVDLQKQSRISQLNGDRMIRKKRKGEIDLCRLQRFGRRAKVVSFRGTTARFDALLLACASIDLGRLADALGFRRQDFRRYKPHAEIRAA